MKSRWFALLLLLSLLLGACSPKGTPSPTPVTPAPTTPPTSVPPTSTPSGPNPDALYLAIIWHQHQPVYYKDPQTNVYAKPWVRLHAAKDYVDMAAMLKQYPKVHVTFNLTPSLIRQLDDYADGAKDAYWTHTEIPAAQLTEDDKRFILRYFFDINPKIIARFPRYVELQAKRPADDDALSAALAGGWSEQDFRDLQVLFNLAWTDPDWLAQEPLASLVAKGRDFSEEDKQTVLDKHLELIRQVIPLHKEMQESGQIEVTMTPYAHPILPLLVDTNLAKVALPSLEVPVPPFRYGGDAVLQLQKGVQLYQDHFGVAPRGMWPAEGSVAQQIVNMVARSGIQWMASDEGVLAKSLGKDSFARNTDDVVQDADALYRPYTVMGGDKKPVAMVFRDTVLSDKVGFTYSGVPGSAAAGDFIKRLHDIQAQLEQSGASGPHLVMVILDGENAWENYPNDGKDFLNSLYQKLSADDSIITVTPSEYLAMFPDEPSRAIEDLWPGSWISHDFSTWIGEDEENRAWDYLRQVREMLQKYENGSRTPPSDEALAQAQDLMCIAEGSDWFWWYGADQNSGSDADFDQQYRDTLKQIYTVLDLMPPDWLSVPIIAAAPAQATQNATALISPEIDGQIAADEWEGAGVYTVGGGVMASGGLPLTQLAYGFDAHTLYLRLTADKSWAALTSATGLGGQSTVGIYLLPPGGGEASAFSRYGGAATYLGFGATRLLEVTFGPQAQIISATLASFDGQQWVPEGAPVSAAVGEQDLEIALPLTSLVPETGVDSGDRIQMRVVLSQGTGAEQQDKQLLPSEGPALIVVPDLGLTTQVLEVNDPENDDYGAGTLTYPTDAVFQPGAFDATSFSVGYDDTYIVFRLTLRGPLENVWNSPNGVSVQTVDIYIDEDGPQNGARMLLPGRNAALTPEHAWDYAIWVEGWTPGVYVPGDEAPQQVDAEMVIIADPGQSKITVKVPRAVLGDDPTSWSYAAVVLGQEGFPAAGVWRVRDVNPTAEQWRFGGGPNDATHSRIIDFVWPEAGVQEQSLSTYKSADDPAQLSADDFAQLPMLTP